MSTHDMILGLALIGALALAASFMVGSNFHPPGEGYAEERREMRISLALMVVGVTAITLAILAEPIRDRLCAGSDVESQSDVAAEPR